jgi:hypothetical protein
MLKYEVPDLSQVAEALRGCYEKTEAGAYRLALDGYETPEQLRAGLAAEKAAARAAVAELARLEKLAAESATRLAEQEPEDARRKAEQEAQLNRQYEQENTRKLAEYTASKEAEISSLRADRNRVVLEHAALNIAAKLARAEYVAVLLPHIAERLEGREEGGVFSVHAKDAPDLDALAEQFRADKRFERIIVGASPAEKARHAARVAETLGVKAAQQPITRKQFESLPPERRAESVRAGTTILDG